MRWSIWGRVSSLFFGGEGADFDDFTNESADGLFEKVDILGMIGTTMKSWISAFFLFLAGIYLAARKMIVDVWSAVESSIFGLGEAIYGIPTDAQSAATGSAAESLVGFGPFALPVGTVVVLASLLVAVILIRVFIGGGS